MTNDITYDIWQIDNAMNLPFTTLLGRISSGCLPEILKSRLHPMQTFPPVASDTRTVDFRGVVSISAILQINMAYKCLIIIPKQLNSIPVSQVACSMTQIRQLPVMLLSHWLDPKGIPWPNSDLILRCDVTEIGGAMIRANQKGAI